MPHQPIALALPDGRAVTIREMDDSYIYGGDMRPNPRTGRPGCCTADGVVSPAAATPNPVFEAYHREARRRYGQSVILAWHGDRVVGFINFHPLNAAFDVLCPHDDSPANGERLAAFGWPDEPSSTLRILCVSLAPGYRRLGLGTRLAKALICWAPDWGYRRLHVGANERAWWNPCRPFWEQLGFEVVKTIFLDEPNAVGDTRVFVMEREV